MSPRTSWRMRYGPKEVHLPSATRPRPTRVEGSHAKREVIKGFWPVCLPSGRTTSKLFRLRSLGRGVDLGAPVLGQVAEIRSGRDNPHRGGYQGKHMVTPRNKRPRLKENPYCSVFHRDPWRYFDFSTILFICFLKTFFPSLLFYRVVGKDRVIGYPWRIRCLTVKGINGLLIMV